MNADTLPAKSRFDAARLSLEWREKELETAEVEAAGARRAALAAKAEYLAALEAAGDLETAARVREYLADQEDA
jgi:hypothetical protein